MSQGASSSQRTFNIRHRLVGAVILVVAAVVLLPMILKGAAPDPITVDIKTPSEQRAPKVFVSRVQPLGVAKQSVPAAQTAGNTGEKVVTFQNNDASGSGEDANTAMVRSAPPAAPPAPSEVLVQPPAAPQVAVTQPNIVVPPAPKVVAPTPTPAPAPEAAPAPAPAPEPAKPQPAQGNVPDSGLKVKTDRGWVVRVGTFGEPANARAMVRRLNTKGFEPQTTREKTPLGKTLTRVWVGPYSERVTAGRVLDEVLKATGEKGFIAPFP